MGRVGNTIVGSVKEVRGASTLKKGDVVRGVIVTTKVGVRRRNGVRISFGQNGRVLVNKKGELRGTRVRGVLPVDLRQKGYAHVLSLSAGSV